MQSDTQDATISALAMPGLDPGTARISRVLPAGATVAEIVAEMLPGYVGPQAGIRVVLVTERGSLVVSAEIWHRVRPKAGVRVIVRVVPGKGALRAILTIVVLIAAVAIAAFLGPMLAGTFGLTAATWTTIITTTIVTAGNLLINALIPARPPRIADAAKEANRYTISGLRNQANPDGAIPAVLGKMRVAPVYACAPYTEVVGDNQYIRALFCVGYGHVKISDIRLGETSIDEYDEVELEVREGVAGDDPIALYPQQVIEEGMSVELTRPYPRDDAGEIVSGSTPEDKPVVRRTATDVTEVAVILGWPQGLARINDEGKPRSLAVGIQIHYRKMGSLTWIGEPNFNVVAAQTRPFMRAYRWTLPERGTYEIRLRRYTAERTASRYTDNVFWQALQSFRPEYPINFEHPLALIAVRIKATYQLNGQIDDLNCMASRVAPDWDATSGTWITRETRSPAAAYRWALQGPAATYPALDQRLDLDQIADWSQWCAAKGLTYDRLHNYDASLQEALLDITSAGRATPRDDGVKWGVVIDRPQSLVVDHINPRNSRDFRWSRPYARLPDAFRVPFTDASNDFQKGERLVPWPGHTGTITVTEQLEHPGKTDPDEIWIETRRRQHEIEHRPDRFQVTQDGAACVAVRGDQVAVSYDTLERTHMVARVRRVLDQLVELDGDVAIGDGAWAMRFRVFSGDQDVLGESLVRPILTGPGLTGAIRLAGSGAVPRADEIVHIGPAASESLICIVKAVERGEDSARILHLVAAAPEIDTLTDAEEPPAWDGRVGSTIGLSETVPAVPVFVGIYDGLDGTEDPDGLTVRIEPGPGNAAVVGSYQIDHRLSGAGTWTTKTVTAAAGGGDIVGYHAGQTVEIRARALSIYGIAGGDTPVISVTIGSADVVVPDVATLQVVRLASGVRRYTWTLGEGDTSKLLGYRIRLRPGTGYDWEDLGPAHTGLLSASPWETSEPLAEGTFTIGAVAVDFDGNESPTPLLIETTLGPSYGAGVLIQRIERDLGWPGTTTGASVVADDLVGGATLPSSFTYTLPVIDLGSDTSVTVAAVAYGLAGTATLTMRTGLASDGAPVGSATALGTTLARYIEIEISVSNASAEAVLGDLVTLITPA
ncbi:hypothetical protein C8N35_102148 [Breoghania corrubedonensis]|uniref:Tip attachment protein J HDII-ins2 domain-containing protein n=1 Tax=Breoghania corrubedonensis TaxID=665038 RepID=A0A2T5VCE6_9HYPH|nr:phage tail protein [Breoghania corrubedonensis]PTW61439.1 hypothetical protein C8N35_102148 [Breoghania corrubedonensis]